MGTVYVGMLFSVPSGLMWLYSDAQTRVMTRSEVGIVLGFETTRIITHDVDVVRVFVSGKHYSMTRAVLERHVG